MKILFVGVHRPKRSPSQRVRMEQFFPALRARGHELEYQWLLDERDDAIFYGRDLPKKASLVVRAATKAIAGTFGRYDRVFVQREAFFLGGPWIERRYKAPIIYDFDDAIWIRDVSPGNRALAWLKNTDKPAQLMALASRVIAGNDYLADYARKHARNVQVIPTVVDTDAITPGNGTRVGWMGSPATSVYVEPLLPLLKAYDARIVGDARIGEKWDEKTEIETLRGFGIGVMPLPDTPWTRGKCGFKALQYMAAGAVPIVSPVGVNRRIVAHRENGWLAEAPADWRDALAQLTADPSLRQSLAHAARQTVVAHWSLAAWRDTWVTAVEEA